MAQRRTKNNILRSSTMSAAGDAKESCRSDGGASSGHVSPVRLPRPHSVAGRLPNYAMPTVASRIRICMSTDKLPDYNVLPTCCRYSRPASPQLVFIKVKPRRSHSVDTTLSSPRRSVKSDVGSSIIRPSRPGIRRDRIGGLESPPHLFRPAAGAMTSHNTGGGSASAHLNTSHRTFSLRRPKPRPATDLDSSLRSFTSKPATTGVQNVPAIRFDKKSSMGSLDASNTAASKTITSSPISKKSKIVSENEGRSAFANISPRTPAIDKKITSPSTGDSTNHPQGALSANSNHNQPKHSQSQSSSHATDVAREGEDKNITKTDTPGHVTQNSKDGTNASVTLDNKVKQLGTGSAVTNHAVTNPSPASKVIVSPPSNSAAKATTTTNKVSKPPSIGGSAKRSITPSAGLVDNDVHGSTTSRTTNVSGATNGPTASANTLTANTPKTSSSTSPSVGTHKVSGSTSVNTPKGAGVPAASSGKVSTIVPGNTPKVSGVTNGGSSKQTSGQGLDTSKVGSGSSGAGKGSAVSGGDTSKPAHNKSSNGSTDGSMNKTMSTTVPTNRTSTPTSSETLPVKDSSHRDSPSTASTGKTTPRPAATDLATSPTKQDNVKQTPTATTTSAVPDAAVEEYRAKLAEKRRLARLRADNAAEEERIKQEQLKQAEEERVRREEEEEARQEAEELRLAAEAATAERERFLKLVEGEEKRKQEEAERIELEKQEKLEKERESKEEAERMEAERQAKIKRDEEEKNERKKRLESIMKRVKTDDVPAKVDTISTLPPPVTDSIPSSISTIDDTTPTKIDTVNGLIPSSTNTTETSAESNLVHLSNTPLLQPALNEALITPSDVTDNTIQVSDTSVEPSHTTASDIETSSGYISTDASTLDSSFAGVANDLLETPIKSCSTLDESFTTKIPAGVDSLQSGMDSLVSVASFTPTELNHTIVDTNGIDAEQKSNDEEQKSADEGNKEQLFDVSSSIMDANNDKQRIDDVSMNLIDFAVKVAEPQST